MNPGWWSVSPAETSFPTEHTQEREVEGEGVIEVRVKLVPLPLGMTSPHRRLATKESNAPTTNHRGLRCVSEREKTMIVIDSEVGRKMCVSVCVCHVFFCLLWHVSPTGVYLLLLFSAGFTFPSAFYPLICPPFFLTSLCSPPHPSSFLLLSGYPNWHATVPSVISRIALEAAVTLAGNSRIEEPLHGQAESPALKLLLF